MKAIITSKYGGVEVLQCRQVENPVIKDNEILVQVHACSVNPIDWKFRKGDFKILTGRKPPKILGRDYAGIVAEVGSRITEYKPKDAVWGFVGTFKRGTYAEFLKVTAEEIGPMPKNLNFAEAAVQIAKALWCEVTGVCSTNNLTLPEKWALMRSLIILSRMCFIVKGVTTFFLTWCPISPLPRQSRRSNRQGFTCALCLPLRH
jgi:hypothetical protein